MQHQRHVQRPVQGGDPCQVQGGAALGHGVRGADRDGQRVDASRGDEGSGLCRVGQDSRSVGPVFSAHLPQFRLDVHAARVGIVGHPAGGGDVVRVVHLCAVVHH